MPPTIVLLGTRDELVPGSTAEKFQEDMQAADSRSELVFYEGQPHGFFNYGRSQNKYYIDTVIAIDRFLASLGYLEGEPTLNLRTTNRFGVPLVSTRRGALNVSR